MAHKIESSVVHYHFSSKEAVDALLIYLHDHQHVNVSVPRGAGIALSVAPDGEGLIVSIISDTTSVPADSEVTYKVYN